MITDILTRKIAEKVLIYKNSEIHPTKQEIESHQIGNITDQDPRELEEARSNSDGSGILS